MLFFGIDVAESNFTTNIAWFMNNNYTLLLLSIQTNG